MTLLNPAAFLFAALVPIVVLLYLLKIRRRDAVVSTLRFWQRIAAENRRRTFWQKHRDKLTLAMGTGGGAIIGGLIGGKRGAGIGSLVGLGSSALYTYKIRKRSRRY